MKCLWHRHGFNAAVRCKMWEAAPPTDSCNFGTSKGVTTESSCCLSGAPGGGPGGKFIWKGLPTGGKRLSLTSPMKSNHSW